MSERYEVRIDGARADVYEDGRWMCQADTEDDAKRIAAALNAQEERLPPTMTPEEAREFQRWEGMDGAIAYQLIERHADGWADVGVMMNAWLEANALNAQAGAVEALRELREVVIAQNNLGASWHPEIFGRLMAALQRSQQALAAAPQPQALCSNCAADGARMKRQALCAFTGKPTQSQARAEDVALVSDVMGLLATHADFPSAVKAWQRIRADYERMGVVK